MPSRPKANCDPDAGDAVNGQGRPAPTHPVTPDGRYVVVRGRLWRRTNPGLTSDEQQRLTKQLMDARRMIGRIKRSGQGDLVAARASVDAAKVALGERGPVWWQDGAPDYNRHMARTTPYRDWFAALE